MQSALTRVGLLPPPATGTVILTGLDGARAGCAANTRIAAIMQHVVRQLLGEDVGPDLGLGPVEQRAHLGNPMRIARDGRPIRARLGLFAPQSRDPGVISGNRAPEGLDLADLAAGQ